MNTSIVRTINSVKTLRCPLPAEEKGQPAAESAIREETEERLKTQEPDKEKEPIPKKSSPPIRIVPAAVRAVKKIRVAAYCRVSTGFLEQESSIENQRDHYEKMIRANLNWEMVGIYWEVAVTGTKKECRPELQRLLADCEAGRIDIVLTKSISRFARNTLECLEMIRRLKELNVTIRFEKENIDTGTMESELMLTLFSAFAEEESHSISRNETWTKRKQFQNGTFKYSTAPYGYRLKEGTFEVDQERAEVVREIYRCVLSGMGTPTIAKMLNERGVPTGTKKRDGSPGTWSSSMLGNMISNVAYVGDALMQKTFRDEHFRLLKNYGEYPQYYCEGHHEAIIDRETFELANAAFRQRGREKGNIPQGNRRLRDNPHRSQYVFSGRLKCGCCGGIMKRATKKVTGGTRVYWSCSTHLSDRKRCGMTSEFEEAIKNAFVTMMNKLAFGQDILLRAYLETLEKDQVRQHRQKKAEYERRREEIAAERERYSMLISKGCGNPLLLRQSVMTLDLELNQISAELILLQGDPASVRGVKELKKRIRGWKRNPSGAFSEELFDTLVEYAVIRTSAEAEFHLKCGMILTEPLGGG